jgi:CRISPR/Cas system-associated protein Csm6
VKKVITTVGTSLITNYQREKNDGTLRGDFNSIDGVVDYLEPLDSSEYDCCRNQGDIKAIRKVMELKWLQGVRWDEYRDAWVLDSKATENTKASAELSTLYKFKAEHEFDTVYFICTDTALSVLAAECMKDYSPLLQGIDVHIIRIPHLKVKDYDEFKKNALGNLVYDEFKKHGLSNLVEKIVSIINQESAENLLMNISGGYKAFLPFLTVLTQIYKIPAFYLYEESEQLIQFPLLPINFDWEFAQAFNKTLETKTDGIALKKNIGTEALAEFASRSLISNKNGSFELTKVGEIYGAFAKNFQKKQDKKEKDISGCFAEYKWLEHYYEKYSPCKVFHGLTENSSVSLVGRCYHIGPHEIDLIIERENDFIVCECKSIVQFRHLEKMSEVIKNRLYFNPPPSEFHFCVNATILIPQEKTEIETEVINICKGLFCCFNDTEIIFKVLLMYTPVSLHGFIQNSLSSMNVVQLDLTK